LVRVPPYIYTPAEIGRLIAAAGRLKRSYPLRRQVYTTLIGLIAATGLRVSETLELRLDDILPNGALRIRKTKFAKSRLVPLHPTAVEALGAYLAARQRVAIPDGHLFVSVSNCRITSNTVDYTFRQVLRLAGIAPDRDRRPRLHDLRHTFATRSLEQCSTRRESVARHFVALATYLGHADIANTYWYLEATPELLADIAAAGASLVNGRSA
jgi:integrase